MEKCWICGKEMVNTIGGNYHCPTCGVGVNDGVFRTPSNCDMPLPQGFVEQKGWICPVCGRGLSPWTSFCPCQSDTKITYGTGTGGDVDLSEYQDMMYRMQKALDDGEIKL
jgi:hypothetical protein